MNFKELILKRRACKLFNDKKISEEDLHFILESGILAPSSHGFEPWKFIILDKKEDNQKLAKLYFDQASVASASHNIILLARKDLQSKDEFAQKQIRRFAGSKEENFQKILKIYTHDTDTMDEKELYHFAQLQCYLAMMQMSLAAMSLGIDSCMIGGYEKDKVDDFLKLEYPFETAVILSLGYQAHEPKYPTQRLKFDEVVEFYKEEQ
ncbi:TPA: nitroreductase family protein [Campylobacter coli]|nr:nitroreductase family protein [Campylobacter coli]